MIVVFALGICATATITAEVEEPQALLPMAALDVPSYMGTWYQVAWFPNRFQSQCVSDTTATYRQIEEGLEVINRCRTDDGTMDEVIGVARTNNSTIDSDLLQPAQLEVSFLPSALRWLPVWGDYWVIALADDGRYAVVSEPSRDYLWVLSRTSSLSAEDEATIRAQLVTKGFDLKNWQAHPHTPTGQ